MCGFVTYLLFFLTAFIICILKVVKVKGKYLIEFPGILRRRSHSDSPCPNQEMIHEKDIENMHKFGPIWTMSEGETENVFIADPKHLKNVLVKDFAHFHSRNDRTSGDPILGQMMNSLHGEKWKWIRSIFSPGFTTGRINEMKEAVESSIGHLIEQIQNNDDVDVLKLYSKFTIEVLFKAFFGIEASENLIKEAQKLTADKPNDETFSLYIKDIFPQLDKIIFKISNYFKKDSPQFFLDLFRHIHRESLSPNMYFFDRISKCTQTPLDEISLFAQGLLFIFAAHDTGTLALTALTAHLASNPQAQEKILLGARNKDKKYVTSCIKESLRLHSPLVRLRRKCQKDYESGDLKIGKGTMIYVPIYALHMNPALFPNPERFIPERFLHTEDVTPYSFLPFGAGPRNCLGMRFAIEEMILTIEGLLKNYKFLLLPETEMRFKKGMPFNIGIKNPVKIRFQPRESPNLNDK